MKYFFDCLKEVSKKMQYSKNCIFMFDFDGTLSKIAKTPEEAYLKKSTKSLLKQVSKHFYLAIISGRSLADVKNKVGLPNLIYAGNHGLEWEISGRKNSIKITDTTKKSIKKAKIKFKILSEKYAGILIEDKNFGFTVHYRNLPPQKSINFLKELKENNYFLDEDGLVLIIKGKKVLDFLPNIRWNKGKFVNFLIRYLKNKDHCYFSSFYVGDDKTDEDAFKIMQKNITIRMGKSNDSSAHYFAKIDEINRLLLWLNSTV